MLNKGFWSRVLLTSALAGGLLVAVGSSAYAAKDYSNDCRSRLEADRARIDRDAARYGEHSKAVDRDVARMNNTRQWCRDHKADWDHSRFDIGIYFRP